MMARLLLLFTVVPAVELYLLLRIGQWLGAGTTALLILATGSLGAFLAKREGLGVLRRLQAEAMTGLPPGDRIVEGVLVLVGGVLLITPGVLTDLAGFLLIAPWSRRWLAPRVKERAVRWLASPHTGFGSQVQVGAPPPPPRRPEGFQHPVAEPDPPSSSSPWSTP